MRKIMSNIDYFFHTAQDESSDASFADLIDDKSIGSGGSSPFSKLKNKTEAPVVPETSGAAPMYDIDVNVNIGGDAIDKTSVKTALLERAAENAFQNRDAHLASAFYDEVEYIARKNSCSKS